MTEPKRCFKCGGKGKYRAKTDLLLAVFTFGLTALIDKSAWIRCTACDGRGYIK